MKKMIAPSMMCADFLHLEETLRDFDEGGIEYLHFDVMDGEFVPNFTLGPDFCRMLKKATSIPLDLHLMIQEPERKLDWFPIGEGDLVSIHCESTHHLRRAIHAIRQRRARPMVALNPDTPLSVLDYVLDDIDGVLVMTVDPGFAGQKLVSSGLQKLRDVRAYLEQRQRGELLLEVDGNVSWENAGPMSRAGANLFVAGTSSIFQPDAPLPQQIRRLRGLLGTFEADPAPRDTEDRLK